MQLEKLQNILKMDSSDKEVLLESSCFLLNYHQEQIKSKKKRLWVRVREIFQVIFIMNFLAKVVKKNVQTFRVWLSPLLFIKILLKTAQLFSKDFPPALSLSLCSFISFFIKARILLQFISQAFIILYMFSLFSFVFINALITST